MAITQVISDFPDAPSSGEDPSDFNNKANAFVAHQADVYVDEVNTWASQSRTLADELNGIVDGATDSASQAAASATASAQSATESANSASESEYYAQQSANSANFLGEWLVGTTYNQPASVLYGDVTYLLLIPTSTGEQPDLVPNSWYALDTISNKVSKAGDTMTGHLNVPIGAVGTQAPQMQEVESKINLKLNADGSQRVGGVLDADGYTISGNNLSAFSMRNKLINGQMKVDQRGGSPYTGTALYTLDRWQQLANCEVRRVSSVRDVESGNQNWMELRGNSSSISQGIAQKIEYGYEMRFKEITISFEWEYIGGVVTQAYLALSTDTNSNLVGTPAIPSPSVTGRKSITVTLPDITFGEYVALAIRINSSTATNAIVRITDVQLEEGSVATPFEQRPIGMELALCQRYYETIDMNWRGYAAIAGQYIRPRWFFAVQKRNFPAFTVIEGAASGMTYNGTNQNIDPEGIDIDLRSSNTGAVFYYARYIADAEL